jgi:hypothetical protein
MIHKQTALTERQKLAVIGYNYYSGGKERWEPKVGDYYTTPRADLDLYRIVREDEDNFYTVYCHTENCTEAQWKKDEFLKGFGEFRIHVHEFVFDDRFVK